MGVEAPPARGARVAEYARGVVAGEIVAGRLVRFACERHLRDLETAEARGLWFDQSEADRVAGFFGHLKQSKGRWAGRAIELMPWQEFVLGAVFGWRAQTGQCAACGSWYRVDEGGRVACILCGTVESPFESEPVETRWLRRFRKAYVEIARKNTKTTTGAGVGLYLLDFDGEPGAEVYAAATKRDQAKICWTEAARMVRQNPRLSGRIREIESRANLNVLTTGSKFEALGADSDTIDGLNPSGAIIDEVHAHRDGRLIDKLETAVGAREQPLFFYITTAGVPGESVYDETHRYAAQVVEGVVDDDTWFVYIATLDPEDDWTDPAVYRKANPSLGVTVQLEELIQERDRALAVPGRQNAFRRLRLNQQVEQVTRWLSVEAWDACRQEIDWSSYGGRKCFVGLDLGGTTDLNAAVFIFPGEPGVYDVRAHYWMPAANVQRRVHEDRVPYDRWIAEGWITATEGNARDDQRILDDLRALGAECDVVEIAIDPWQMNYIATQLVADRGPDGVIRVPQGYAHLAAASEELEKIITTGALRHDGNPVLRWNIANVTADEDAAGNRKPSKAKSRERIDGVSALVTALSRAILQAPSADWVLQ